MSVIIILVYYSSVLLQFKRRLSIIIHTYVDQTFKLFQRRCQMPRIERPVFCIIFICHSVISCSIRSFFLSFFFSSKSSLYMYVLYNTILLIIIYKYIHTYFHLFNLNSEEIQINPITTIINVPHVDGDSEPGKLVFG